MSTIIDTVTKEEQVTINLTLDKKHERKHKKSLKELTKKYPPIYEGDTLSIKYEFNVLYLNNIEQRLNALYGIITDKGVVVDASCEELEQGRILVYKILKKLEAVIKEVKSRSPYQWRSG